MPNYDYKCLNCDDRFEHFQSMKEEPLRLCVKCGGTLKRLIGPGAGPIFKGSGFYQTDYKNSKTSSTVNKSEISPKQESTTKTEVKKESKSKAGVSG